MSKILGKMNLISDWINILIFSRNKTKYILSEK